MPQSESVGKRIARKLFDEYWLVATELGLPDVAALIDAELAAERQAVVPHVPAKPAEWAMTLAQRLTGELSLEESAREIEAYFGPLVEDADELANAQPADVGAYQFAVKTRLKKLRG